MCVNPSTSHTLLNSRRERSAKVNPTATSNKPAEFLEGVAKRRNTNHLLQHRNGKHWFLPFLLLFFVLLNTSSRLTDSCTYVKYALAQEKARMIFSGALGIYTKEQKRAQKEHDSSWNGVRWWLREIRVQIISAMVHGRAHFKGERIPINVRLKAILGTRFWVPIKMRHI